MILNEVTQISLEFHTHTHTFQWQCKRFSHNKTSTTFLNYEKKHEQCC
jgi:hypothetical protein